MGRKHGAVIHLVHVIARQDQHEARIVAANDVYILVHRVGGAGVPRGLDPLLRRQQLHELAELAAQEAPALLDVQQQGVGLVLRQHADAADAGVHAVGQGEVYDAEFAAEGNGGLGAP